LTGTIDKLLIVPAAGGRGLDVEIIDFKTNRFRTGAKSGTKPKQTASVATVARGAASQTRVSIKAQPAQGLFDFESPATETSQEAGSAAAKVAIQMQIENTAHDYQLQMQSYALALRELLPSDVEINSLRATLHFIDPNVEVSIPAEHLEFKTCARAIDDAMAMIASLDGTIDADSFPPLPAVHCRMCKFLDLCPPGREWLRSNRR
jgi:predicted RecB family nuclease